MYSKGYLQSYHTHIPVSFFETKMQNDGPHCVHVGRRHQRVNVHGARACFSVFSGIHFVQHVQRCGDNSRAATNRERRLIEQIR